jgi:hypothetical protein
MKAILYHADFVIRKGRGEPLRKARESAGEESLIA